MRQGQEETYYGAIITKMLHEFKLRRPQWKVTYAKNDYLPNLIKIIEGNLEIKTRFPEGSVPPLKVDILFGIQKDTSSNIVNLVLFEVKRDALQLIDYSQLFGYLFAGKYIDTGVLFRVIRENDKGKSAIVSSPEFETILKTNKLPLKFIVKDEAIDAVLNFQIGIAYAVASEAICQKPTWIPTQANKGICSIDELIDRITNR